MHTATRSIKVRAVAAIISLPFLGWACQDQDSSLGLDGPGGSFASANVVVPSPLVSNSGTRTLSIWPFAQAGLTGGEDPINLILANEGDPRAVRAALMALNGDRTAFGFPNVAPFDCTWTDAIGGVMAGYADRAGWTGSAVQLSCGPYGPIRFHLRLFDVGGSIAANAHFEVLIPGTADHQVLSWELAEQLVTVDLLRTGLLDPVAPVSQTGQINPSPFREIIPAIYNGLPASLRGLIGGSLADVTTPQPIATDGRATVLAFAQHFVGPSVGSQEDLTITYGQVIPKPFCGGPNSFLYVEGPVRLHRVLSVGEGGMLRGSFEAQGRLTVTPFDPTSGPMAQLYPPRSARFNTAWSRGIATGFEHPDAN